MIHSWKCSHWSIIEFFYPHLILDWHACKHIKNSPSPRNESRSEKCDDLNPRDKRSEASLLRKKTLAANKSSKLTAKATSELAKWVIMLLTLWFCLSRTSSASTHLATLGKRSSHFFEDGTTHTWLYVY